MCVCVGGWGGGGGGGGLPRPSEPDRALPCPVRGLDGHGRALPGTVGFSPVHIVLIPLPLGPPGSALSSSDSSGYARGHDPRLASPTLALFRLAVSGGKRHVPGIRPTERRLLEPLPNCWPWRLLEPLPNCWARRPSEPLPGSEAGKEMAFLPMPGGVAGKPAKPIPGGAVGRRAEAAPALWAPAPRGALGRRGSALLRRLSEKGIVCKP